MPTSGVIRFPAKSFRQQARYSAGRGRIATVDTAGLQRRLADPTQTIVDVRLLPAFNG